MCHHSSMMSSMISLIKSRCRLELNRKRGNAIISCDTECQRSIIMGAGPQIWSRHSSLLIGLRQLFGLSSHKGLKRLFWSWLLLIPPGERGREGAAVENRSSQRNLAFWGAKGLRLFCHIHWSIPPSTNWVISCSQN